MNNRDLHIDKDLFRRISQGDQAAYTIIYHAYTGFLYSYVLKMLKSELWAEEIVQDVFMNVWINREELTAVDNPAAFLYRITANRMIDWMRKNELDLKVLRYTRLHAGNASNATEELLDFRASAGIVKEAIKSLPPQRKLIYELKNEQGLSYEEIAARLNISKHTVRNQLAKSIDQIRDFVRQKGGISIFLVTLIDFYN